MIKFLALAFLLFFMTAMIPVMGMWLLSDGPAFLSDQEPCQRVVMVRTTVEGTRSVGLDAVFGSGLLLTIVFVGGGIACILKSCD